MRQELSRKADEELFGSKAVAGHQFLVAKPRDINAPASNGIPTITTTTTTSGIEGMLDVVAKTYPPSPSSSSSPSSSANSGGYRDTPATGADDGKTRTSNRAAAGKNSSYDYAGDAEQKPPNTFSYDGDFHDPKEEELTIFSGYENYSRDPEEEEEEQGKRTGKFRERAEQLGENGGVLKRLKPLLDSFIREDAQRTGTLPASDFRRIICEGHGGLWPDLAVGSEGRRGVAPEYIAGEVPFVGYEGAIKLLSNVSIINIVLLCLGFPLFSSYFR